MNSRAEGETPRKKRKGKGRQNGCGGKGKTKGVRGKAFFLER